MNRRLLPLLGALALAACDGSGTLATNAIGSEGGTVRTGDGLAELVVPAGALTEDVAITITAYEGAVPGAAIAPAWDFQPDGLTFEVPAVMRLTLHDDIDPSTVDGATLGWLEGNEFFPIEGDTVVYDDGTVEGEVTHFTPYSVVGGTDNDGDGYTVVGGDCDDNDAAVYPGAPEQCNGADDDCDGVVPQAEGDWNGNGIPDCAENFIDADGDGYPATATPGIPADCDDTDPLTYPGAPERCDGIDNDCDGALPANETDANNNGIIDCLESGGTDADGDGFPASGGGAIIDCDDNDATIYPGAPEQCNGLDDDCDGQIPASETDANGNGILDCNEPGNFFTCFDGNDNDNDGWIDLDDPDCANPQSGQETGGLGTTQCNDGLDNDGDGNVDADDVDCVDGYDTSE